MLMFPPKRTWLRITEDIMMLNATVVPVINILASMSVIRNPENLMIMTKMIVNTCKCQIRKSFHNRRFLSLSYPLCHFENSIKCFKISDIDFETQCCMLQLQLIHKIRYQHSSGKEGEYTFKTMKKLNIKVHILLVKYL